MDHGVYDLITNSKFVADLRIDADELTDQRISQ